MASLAVAAIAALAFSPAAPAQTACSIDSQRALGLLNFMREGGASCGAHGSFAPSPALRWNLTLEAMAQAHANGLAAAGELRHTDEHGQTMGQRALAAGYRYAKVGENLAKGQKSIDVVLHSWGGSESHCVNLFGPLFTETALACAHDARGRAVWVMVVARPR